MAGGLPCGTSPRRNKFMLWLCSLLFSIAGAAGETSHAHHTMSLSAPHMYYTCPEGATVKLVCTLRGSPAHPTDRLGRNWLFTAQSDRHCSGREGPRHSTIGHHHGNYSFQTGASEHNIWLVLPNVTLADQGRYCCVVLDYTVENKHTDVLQKSHSHIILHITPRRNGSQDCTVWEPTTSKGSVPVALAIAACILALLSLPLILVLVYKQRENAHSNRRAQELVRMDSEALGHENPVFLGGSPQIKTRTVSQIMTRQHSETGRHLLSEPGTPLSPPGHGDVFFPIEDTIPESPDFLQV
ncbi:V-type immunoglobulin domain-containing suppressor of T-cell activation [Lates japonicus]|nr:V-type immunoglobulin domain-containing suppressor of T-cell activation [Lates japonicus]